MRALPIVLVAALLGAAGAWLLSRGSSEPRSSSIPAQAPVEPSTQSARSLESDQAAPQHVPAAPQSLISSRPEPIVGPKATLAVVCVQEKDGRAVCGIGVEVAFAARPGDPPERAIGFESAGKRGKLITLMPVTDSYFPPKSDESGSVVIEVPAGVLLHVRVAGGGFWASPDQTECTPLAEGEHKSLRLQLNMANDSTFQGLVVDDASSEPLSGVVVSAHGGSQSPQLATTGNDGRFEVPSSSWGASQFQLEREGYVPLVIHPTAGNEEPVDEQVFRMVRGATVQGFLLGADRTPVNMGSIRIWNDRSSEMRSFCDPHGWYSIDGLPPGVELQIEVEQWRRRVRGVDSLAPLGPGETRRLDLNMPPRVRIEGTAVDEDRAPIAGIELALVRIPSAGLACFDASLVPEETVKTDAEGKFAFSNASEGTWAVGPAMRTERYTARELPVVPLVFTLPGSTERPIEVQIYQHATIRGRVLDADGKPAQDALVRFNLEGCRNSSYVIASEDGAFGANVFGPWTYRVHASSGGGRRDSEEVSARAGEKELVLRLGAAARLEVHATDPRGGEFRDGLLIGVGSSSSTPADSFTASIEPDGRASIELAPGTYRILARVGDTSWSDVHTVRIETGAQSEVEELPLRPTGWVTIDATRIASRVEFELSCAGIEIDEGATGHLEPRDYSVPPGLLTIAYRVENSTGEWKRMTCGTRSGGKSTVVLEP